MGLDRERTAAPSQQIGHVGYGGGNKRARDTYALNTAG
jgi:hypothetical protein